MWTPNHRLLFALEQLDSRLPECPRVLDVGCGTGQTSLTVLRIAPDAVLTGIDLSKEMLAKARAKNPTGEYKQLNILDYVAGHQNEAFDLIVCVGALEFFPDPENFFFGASALLKPDGVLLFTYEPIVLGYKGQSEDKSESKSTRPGSPADLWLITHRYSSAMIREMSHKHEIHCEDLELFVSYKKADHPVIYSLTKGVKNRKGEQWNS